MSRPLSNPIGWCDATVNPVIGCTKVSEGCANCYAELTLPAKMLRTRGIETWGARGQRVETKGWDDRLLRLNDRAICNQCRKTKRWEFIHGHCECGGFWRKIRVFANSLSDWLDPAWPEQLFDRFLCVLAFCDMLDIQLLTKRIENFSRTIEEAERRTVSFIWEHDAPRNIWLGISAENQRRLDNRLPQLREIPAAVRFLSLEPLLEPVTLDLAGIQWVIVGGESGPKFRTVSVDAIVSVVEQCLSAHVPVYVKQDCGLWPGRQGRIPNDIWQIKQFPTKSRP